MLRVRSALPTRRYREFLRQAPASWACVGPSMEIATHAVAQDYGLADIDHLALVVEHLVDAGGVGQVCQFLLHSFRYLARHNGNFTMSEPSRIVRKRAYVR